MKRVFLIILLLVVSVYADDSFGDLYLVFEDWIQGNLGKLLALIGFTITFTIYIMANMTGKIVTVNNLFIGSFISLLAGGLVGIANTFFNLGATTFSIIP